MPAQALAVLATLVSFAPHGNRIEFQLDRGSAEMVWISPTSFHFRRTLDGSLELAAPERKSDPVELKVDDTPAAVHIRSKYLDVAILKRGLLVNVHRADGAAVMVDLSEPWKSDTGVTWEREAPPGVRFYGLGALADPELDLHGKTVDASIPFLLSTAGYGEQHSVGGRFDFTAAGRYRIQTPRVDYYFFFGPTPKEIFKQRNPDNNTLLPFAEIRRPASWDALRDAVLETVHQAMSTSNPWPFPMGNYANAPDELKQRARQFGSLLPNVTPGSIGLTSLRQQLTSFFDIYAIEVRDQSRPIWHALPFQFPEDPECAHHADEFMLGDELLIAPIYESGNKRQVYLPPGNWTSLETNQEFPGRSTIPVETNALPVFARNGTIVPLDSNGGIGLHYFPKAGGEFFLLEKDIGQYTQVHASPALDIVRLEIESKKDRDYQWVVHHVERPTDVGFEEQKYRPVATVAGLSDRTWFYDAAAKNLIVRVRVKAGEDSIINLSW
jgi:Glycosyl hydrolases family 31